MGKLGLPLIVWVISAPTLMGIFILTVLVVPSLAEQETKLMLPAAVAGAGLAIPFSFWVASRIRYLTGNG